MALNRLSNLVRSKSKDETTLPYRAATSKRVNEPLPYGLLTLAEGVDPVVDIVAVHGLDGHREKSWTANNVNWLRTFLPTDIPNARVMSWGYDARTHSFSRIGGKYLYDHGKSLISDLCLKRALTKSSRRPIIFVAHSLGGIVLKIALIHSEAARKGALEEHRSIKLSTYGIIFMGSPHQGAAGVQFGELVLRIASIFIPTDNKALRHIERDSEWLQQQLQQYAPISQSIVTKFAYETMPTTSIAFGRKVMVVPQDSAIVPGTTDGEPMAIPADHVNMVKFASRQDVGYEKVSGHLQVMVQNASGIIRARWGEQDRVDNVLASVGDNFSMPFSLYDVSETEEFIGRKVELRKMEEALHRDGPERAVVVLHGLGGIGKTQLAVQYLKAHRETYSAIFWLNGRTEDTLQESFMDMARRLHDEHENSLLLRTAAELKESDAVVAYMRKWLSIKENHRWILIFDNIDNPKIAGSQDPQAYDIRSYFPEANHGSIIITTRSSSLRIGKVIPIRKLQDPKECIAILSSMFGLENLHQDSHIEKLAAMLDGLPLALATAGAYLGQVSTSLEEYIRYYNKSWLKLQKTSPESLSYKGRTLYSTWNSSFEHIKSQNESAAQLLRLWAYLDNHDVWYELLAAGKNRGPAWFSDIVEDELSFNQVIRLLCDHGLVESFEAPGQLSKGYAMHSCVHNWTKHVLGLEDDIEMEKLVFSCVGSSVPTKQEPNYQAIQMRLLPHANERLGFLRSTIDVPFENSQEYCDDIFSLGALFADQGMWNEAELMYQRALEGYEKALGLEHSSTLSTVHNLGTVYQGQSKLDKAEAMYQRALNGKEKSLGPDHPSTLETAEKLGTLYSD